MGEEDNSADRVGYFSNEITKVNLKPGDHIYVYRSLLYSHHGIYIGEPGMEVIHFSNPDGTKIKNDTGVNVCTLDEFLANGVLRIAAYGASWWISTMKWLDGNGNSTSKKSLPAKQVIENAKWILECTVTHPEKVPKYDLVRYNCEHFATICKTGKGTSWQTWPLSEGGIKPIVFAKP